MPTQPDSPTKNPESVSPTGGQSSTTNVVSAAPRNPKKQWLQDATATRTSEDEGPSAEPEIEEVPRNGRIVKDQFTSIDQTKMSD